MTYTSAYSVEVFFSADGIFLIQTLGVWVAAGREELKCLQLIIKFQRLHVRAFHYLIIYK